MGFLFEFDTIDESILKTRIKGYVVAGIVLGVQRDAMIGVARAWSNNERFN